MPIELVLLEVKRRIVPVAVQARLAQSHHPPMIRHGHDPLPGVGGRLGNFAASKVAPIPYIQTDAAKKDFESFRDNGGALRGGHIVVEAEDWESDEMTH